MHIEELNPVRSVLERPAAEAQGDTMAAGKALIDAMLASAPESFREALLSMQARIDAAQSPEVEVDSRQILVEVMGQFHRHMERFSR